MGFKSILVHLDGSAASAQRLVLASDLAREHGAHLTGVYVMPPLLLPFYIDMPVPAELLAEHEQAEQAAAREVEAKFKAATAGFPTEGFSAEWRCAKGYADVEINRLARYIDLVIAGQAPERELLTAYADLPDQIVLGSARPVLLIPYIGAAPPIGKRVLVAWNGRREVVRAVNDALPLLARAAKVEVIAINPPASEGDIPCADICLHLARHGVTAEASQMVASAIDVGDVLLSRAADRGCDLIVMGAYGHTRLRETILGGVTKHMLKHMTVPVLMSH